MNKTRCWEKPEAQEGEKRSRKARRRVQTHMANGSFSREAVFGSSFGAGGLEGSEVVDKYTYVKTRAAGETVPSVELRTKIPIFSELE